MSGPLEDAEVVLVSACLLGEACRYDGRASDAPGVARALAGKAVIPICPEAGAGLGVPRPAVELSGGDGQDVLAGRAAAKVKADGREVTRAFLGGAQLATEAVERYGVRVAILKDRSPSCGSRTVWVDGRLQPGEGVTCAALRNAGVTVLADEEVSWRP